MSEGGLRRTAFRRERPGKGEAVACLLLLVLLVPLLAGCFGPGVDAGEPEEGTGLPMDWTYEPQSDRLDGSPYGVHLSFLEDPRTSLTVTWFTAGLDDVSPVVFWGEEPNPLERGVVARSHQAYEADVLVHVATIRDLEPGQWIHYQVCGSTGCSEVFDARTAPPAGEPFRFGLIADHETRPESLNATGTLLALRPDLVVIAGDLSHADGRDQDLWDHWFHMHEPLFARVPVLTAPGAHEYKDGGFYGAYRSRFALPNEGLWYGLDYSDVRFTFLEFYLDSKDDGHLEDQKAFFFQELEETQARKADDEVSFHFVVQHYSLHGNHHKRGEYSWNLNLQEEPILRHGVDFLLAGHDHYYDRSYPKLFGEPTTWELHDYTDPVGYIQMVAGGGGSPLGTIAHPGLIGEWSAVHEREHHVAEFQIGEGRVEARTWATDGSWELIDHFNVTRTRAQVDATI